MATDNKYNGDKDGCSDHARLANAIIGQLGGWYNNPRPLSRAKPAIASPTPEQVPARSAHGRSPPSISPRVAPRDRSNPRAFSRANG